MCCRCIRLLVELGKSLIYALTISNEFFLILAGRLFIGMQWALISLQSVIAAYIPDIPYDVNIQTQRNEFIVSKLILNVADEDFGAGETDDNDDIRLSAIHQNKGKRKSVAVERPAVPVAPFPRSKPANGWPETLKLNVANKV